ncbi:hypothetical protein ACGFJ7_27760 [Actinoplanes sp. NPDC048988]|uniref:hypothetical protein n=1 Tax=Actinoplanes sp. NPDC048988 TaxID=3363901 RepID=UPI003716690E
MAYDGRCGDGGVDVLVRQGTRLRIFQLKYFRDGFGSDHSKRRRQIKNSFTAAMQHDPAEWILVIPTNPTLGEEKFVLDMGQDRPELELRIMGRQQLDSHLSRFLDLTEYFVRDSLLHHAKAFGQEKALLLGGLSDLIERTRALAGVADTLDLDWGVDTAMRDGVVVHTVRPKHERAVRKSPISFSFDQAFGAADAGVKKMFDRVVGFGASEEVVLPPEITRRLTFTNPDWLAPPPAPYELIVRSVDLTDRIGAEATFHLLDDEGNRRSSYRASIVHAGVGSRGYSLDLRLQDDTMLSLLVGETGIDLRADFSPHRWTPTQALQTIAFHRNLVELRGCELEVGEHLMTVQRAGALTHDGELTEALSDIELLAEDLDVVQRHCRTFFPIPANISAADRIDIRTARLLIEGHCVVYRGMRAFTMTLNGRYDPSLKEILAKSDVPLRVDSDIDMVIGKNRLSLGRLMFFHTRVNIENRDEVLAALEAGRGEGQEVRFVPENRERFRAILPTARPGRDDEPLIPTPWGLPGIDGPELIQEPGD